MITSNLLAKLFPYTPQAKKDRFIPALNKFLPAYKINTARRIRAFLATCGVETDYFKTTTEYATGAAYNGREDLGNFFKGDGEKFKGRTLIQTTGRFNYWRLVVRWIKKLTGKDYSEKLAYTNFRAYLKSANYDLLLKEADRLNVNFLEYPEKLSEIEKAVESACIFWEENNCNKYADAENFFAVSGIVNRGNPTKKALHYEKRLALYNVCKRWIPENFAFAQTLAGPPAINGDKTTAPPETATGPATPETAVSDRNAENSKVKDFSDKYLKHCKNDSFKNIALVIAGRIGAGISAVWTLNFGGKVFLIIAASIIAGSIIYALTFYRKRIFSAGKTVFDSLFNSQ